MTRTLPMFPLGRVSFPGTVLPLHVFEPRYRQMIEDLLRGATDNSDGPEFGAVLIERGSEVGGGDERSRVASLARLVQVARTPDGRYAVMAEVVGRLRVQRWLPDDPYPLAEVDDWPDEREGGADDGIDEQELAELSVRVRRARALASELGDPLEMMELADDLGRDPALGLFVLCATSPLGDVDRQELLAIPGGRARLVRLEQLLDEAESLLRFRLGG